MARPPIELCQVADARLLGVKGPGAAQWLKTQGLDTLPDPLDAVRLIDDTLMLRMGASDIVFAGARDSPLLARLKSGLAACPPRVFEAPHEEHAFTLRGEKALDLFAQTCALEMRKAPPLKIAMTRVAAVACVLLPEVQDGQRGFWLWADSSYATYLWETLAQIVVELGGQAWPAERRSQEIGGADVRMRPE